MKKTAIILIISMLSTFCCYADMGPKPRMNFVIKYETKNNNIRLLNGKQLECDDENCSSSYPLRDLGPQKFHCNEKECFSLAYGYKKYHKLLLTFSDKTRESNIFEAKKFKAIFSVTVKDDVLIVTEFDK